MAKAATKRKQNRKHGMPRIRRSYDELPEYLPEACEFSDDPGLTDPLSMMRLVNENLVGKSGPVGDLWTRTTGRIAAAQRDGKQGGRPRTKGDWGLIYGVGFLLSRQAEMYSFWDDQLRDGLWREAGFDGRRPYSTMYDNFVELEAEECIAAFDDAADELIALAASKDVRVGREVYVDATNIHGRARLHHCCPDRKACRAQGRAKEVLDDANAQLVKETRLEEVKDAPEPGLRHPDAQASAQPDEDEQTPYKRFFWIDGHRYGVLDPDVGVRAYRTKSGKVKKFWAGGLDMVATDGFTGGSLASIVAPASKQEYNLYRPLMAKTIQALGRKPEVVAGDRGISVEKVFRFNTCNGIASAFPFRRPHKSLERKDMRCLAFDEHGVGRCPVCNGPGEQLPGVFFTQHGYPRIRFRCGSPNTVQCLTESWMLDPAAHPHGWRMLVPLSRLSPRYHAIRQTQQHHERQFRDRRKRYYLDGADETGKLKRFGLAAHRLRAAAARFLEWFRICLRHGWLGSYAKRNSREPLMRNANNRLIAVLKARRWQGIDLPYGPQAHALGLAPDPGIPPWRETRRSKK